MNDARTEELGSTVIVPDMSKMAFRLDRAGVSEANLDNVEDYDGFISVEYKVSTSIENNWDNGVKFTFNVPSENAEYPLLPEGSYTVTSSSEQGFTPGVSEIVYTVKIDKSKVLERNYSLVANVESNGGFTVEGDSESVINLFNRHYYSQSNISVRNCNTYKADVAVLSLPYFIEYELASPVRISDFDLYRRQDRYSSDLKGGHLEVSSDGETYTKVCDFNYAGVSAYRNIHAADIEPEAKYVKFVVTATGRTGGALKVNICYR